MSTLFPIVSNWFFSDMSFLPIRGPKPWPSTVPGASSLPSLVAHTSLQINSAPSEGREGVVLTCGTSPFTGVCGTEGVVEARKVHTHIYWETTFHFHFFQLGGIQDPTAA